MLLSFAGTGGEELLLESRVQERIDMANIVSCNRKDRQTYTITPHILAGIEWASRSFKVSDGDGPHPSIIPQQLSWDVLVVAAGVRIGVLSRLGITKIS